MAPPASRRAAPAAAWGFFLLGKTSLPARSGDGAPILDPDSDPDPDPVEGRGAGLPWAAASPSRRVPARRSSDLLSSALPRCGIRAGSLAADWAAPTSRKRPFPCSGIPLLLLPAALGPVAAMETFTSGTLEALNGTDVRLKCTFRSPVPVGPKLTVSWYFQSELKEPLEAVSHAQSPCGVVRWGREAAKGQRVGWGLGSGAPGEKGQCPPPPGPRGRAEHLAQAGFGSAGRIPRRNSGPLCWSLGPVSSAGPLKQR